MKNAEKKYAVIEKEEYYDGSYKVRMIELCETKECALELAEEKNNEPYYLSHNQHTGYFRAVEIDDDQANYQTWTDAQDWEGCPVEEPTCKEDNAENCTWAEEKAFESGISIYVVSEDGAEYVVSEVL